MFSYFVFYSAVFSKFVEPVAEDLGRIVFLLGLAWPIYSLTFFC